jgi:hypothetical protein
VPENEVGHVKHNVGQLLRVRVVSGVYDDGLVRVDQVRKDAAKWDGTDRETNLLGQDDQKNSQLAQEALEAGKEDLTTDAKFDGCSVESFGERRGDQLEIHLEKDGLTGIPTIRQHGPRRP